MWSVRFGSASLGALFGALLVIVLSAAGFTAPASAAGDSTPGVTVTAVNPGSSRLGSDLNLSLTAHTETSTVADPSCRPEDLTLACWGSLVLRIPAYGDLGIGGFEVHRVAVGDTGCGGCGGDDHVVAATTPPVPVQAQVNGLAVVKWPGNTGLPVGTRLQVKLTLTDNGTAAYGDQVVVQVNRFVEGPDKPLLYQSAPETIKQVQIHLVETPD